MNHLQQWHTLNMINLTQSDHTTKQQLDTRAETMRQLIDLPFDEKLVGNNCNIKLMVYDTFKQKFKMVTSSTFSNDRI